MRMIRGTTLDFLLTVNADLVDKAVFVTIYEINIYNGLGVAGSWT